MRCVARCLLPRLLASAHARRQPARRLLQRPHQALSLRPDLVMAGIEVRAKGQRISLLLRRPHRLPSLTAVQPVM